MAAGFIVGTTWSLNHGAGMVTQSAGGAWVDMAMRHSVMLAYEQNSERFQRFLIAMNYKDPTRKPSNSQFIGMILEKIKQELHRTHS